MPRRTAIEIQIYSPTACVVVLRGAHEADSALGRTLTMAIGGGYRNVLVDLAGCASIALELNDVLLAAAARMRQADGALELVVPVEADSLRTVLMQAGLQGIVPFHETRAAGVASVAFADRLRSHRDESGSLRALSARIDVLQARTESSRARQAQRARPGMTVLRAQIVAGPGSLAESDERLAS